MQNKLSPRQRGFSLLEVLIAVVIMSVGLLALASLQVTIMKSSAEAKTQSMAINLARERLENLIDFKAMEDTSCPGTADSYRCIDSGSDTSFVQGGVTFNRTWTVQRCLPASGTFTCSGSNVTSAYAGATARNEFKTVDVFVSWIDASGVTQTVSLKDSVSPFNPSDIALLQKKSTKVTPRFARERIYDPASEEGVIPIAVGGGTESAATNPKPELVTNQGVVETRFDVLTYSGLNNGAADAQSKVETAMVGCSCDFDQAPVDQDPSTNSARAKRPTYWNGFRYIVPDNATYVPKAGPALNVSQSDKCTICCRDHFDPGSLATGLPKFSPYISSHDHYNSNANGATPVTSGVYKEACRLIRVDGIFRTAADMRNDYFGLLATKDLANANDYADFSVPDPVATGEYQKFVVDYLNTRYTSGSPPNPANSLTGYNNPTGNSGALDPSTLEVKNTPPTRDLNKPATIVFQAGDHKWLHSRGLYIDYLEQEVLDSIAAAKLDTVNCAGANLSICILKLLPFTSINLTEISDWQTSDSNQLQVSTGNYSQAATPGDPVNGGVTQGGSPGNNVAASISTTEKKTNSGLLDLSFDAISPGDKSVYTDAQAFTVGGNVQNNPNDGQFYVYVTFPTGYPTQSPAVSYITGGQASRDCTSPTTSNGVMRRTCIFSNFTNTACLGSVGGLAIALGGSGGGSYNYQDTVAIPAGGIQCTNTNVPDQGSISIPSGYSKNRCYYLEVSTTTVARNTTRNENNTGVNVLSGSGTKSEVTKIDFSRIDADPVTNDTTFIDRIDVKLDQKSNSPVTMGATCTYTCSVNAQNGNINCSGNNKTFNVAPEACP
jgi:prepilin-type N-terminal cleavage/methylation domain-containing protein